MNTQFSTEVSGEANRSASLEQQTAEFLRQVSDVQAELLQVLNQKRELMIANDLEGMQQAQDSEQVLLARLQDLQDSRQELLMNAGERGLPNNSVKSLARALEDPNDRSMTRQASEAGNAMRHIQNETLTNFVLAQQTVLHLSQLLQIIATGGKIKPTYEADNASNQGGTLVDHDA